MGFNSLSPWHVLIVVAVFVLPRCGRPHVIPPVIVAEGSGLRFQDPHR